MSQTPSTAAPAASTSGNTTMAAITHVLALFTWVLGPLVVYFVTDDAFVKENARNALNWQLTFTIYIVVSVILTFVVIGIVGLILFPILDLVFIIVAAVKASDGEAWSYPITLDLL